MKGILTRKGLSYAQVAGALGHKSKTTLHRILKDECSSAAAEKFCRAFLESGLCELSDEEKHELYEALEIFTLGREQYQIHRTMWRMLCGDCLPSEDLPLHVAGKTQKETLSDLLTACSGADSVQIIVLNACQTPLFSLLADLLGQNRHMDIQIEHFLFVNDDPVRTTDSIHAIFPLLCDARYHGRSVRCDGQMKACVGLLRDDWLIMRFRSGATVQEWQAAFFTGAGYALSGNGMTGLFDFWQGMLREHERAALPIKIERTVNRSLSDYFELVQHHMALEREQTLYVVQDDISISLVPPDILRDAFTDGCREAGVDPSSAPFAEAIPRIYALHAARYENMCKKRKSTHYFCTYEDIRRFAATGLHGRPYLYMRPYTVAERRTILSSIRREMQDNPYFDFRLLKESESGLHDKPKVVFFENVGAAFPYANKNDAEADCHTEAILLQKEFIDELRGFFRRELLGRQSMKPEECLAHFDEILRELDERERRCEAQEVRPGANEVV